MITRSSLTLYLAVLLVTALYGQQDSIAIDTIPHTFIGLRAVTSPIASGFELKYVRDVSRSGKEVSIFLSGSNLNARQFCSEFTDTARTDLFITDNLPFDSDISRYEISVRRRAFFAARYSNISYSKKRTFGFRRIFGLRMTHWQVETAHSPYFPPGLFHKCGEGDGLFSSSPGRVEAVELLNSASSGNRQMVYSIEAGFGFSYRTSPSRRLMLAFEANVFGVLPLNQARLSIDSPRVGDSANYTVETVKQLALSLDLGVGLFYRIR